jgi:acyl dehydratase
VSVPAYEQVSVGDELPAIVKPALSRATLALFAGASADPNPVHIDIDAAREAGLPDVIGHGMLTMAYVAQVLTGWVPPSAIRSYSVRFVAPTQIGNVLTCTGTVVAKDLSVDGAVRVALQAVDQFGDVKVRGNAEVLLARRAPNRDTASSAS